MIGGIFETIGKTLGVGKENYFLELDDAAEDTVKGVEKVASKAPAVAKEVTKAAAETGKAAAEAVAEATEAVAETKASTKKAAAPTGKDTKQPSAPKAATAVPVGIDPNDLIVNAIAAGSRKRSSGAVDPDTGEVKNFSTDYLMPKKKMSRRRPGPSFNNFKGMAKTVNPRLK